MFERLALARGSKNLASVAMSWLEGEATFARLQQDVSKISAALLSLRDLNPALVAVYYQHTYRHWVLLLALSKLGIPSASLPNGIDETFRRDLRVLSPDFVLSDDNVVSDSIKSLVLSEEWFENITDNGPSLSEHINISADKVLRVAVASGTHREPHCIALTGRYIETALYHLLFQDTLLKDVGATVPRVVPTIGVDTASGFLVVLAALTSGACVQAVTAPQLGVVFSQKSPTVAIVSPVQAEAILAQLPPGMEPRPELFLTLVGGQLSRSLYEKITHKLTTNIQVVYGTDECSMISALQADHTYESKSVGKPLPWVGLEIVDDNNVPLPAGEVGRIRVMGTGVVDGYYQDPIASAQQFQDGWFYPGDLGTLSAQGDLYLAGRIDDLISLGGNKFDLKALDERLKDFPDVKDAASFVLSEPLAGRERENVIWVALNVAHDFPLDTLSIWVREKFPSLPEIQAVIVDRVPCRDDGQPDRQLLAHSISGSEV